MSYKRIYEHSESDSRRVYTQDNFKSGIRYGINGIRSGEPLQYMDNFILKNGSLVSRAGQMRVSDRARGVCKARCVFNGRLFMQLGVGLYSWDYINEESPKSEGSLSTSPCTMFSFGGKLYILSPDGYFSYGTKLAAVEPYIPVVAIDRSSDGATTTVYESFNMIGNGFEVWFNFSGDGEYKLPLEKLADGFSATLSGVDVTDKCNFDKETGKLTVTGFSEEDEGINNLRVRAYRTDADVAESRSKILGCKYHAVYGGTDGLGTRVFLSGNDSCPNVCFYSGLLDPSYFPDTQYEIVGHSGDRITGFVKQYDELIVFCENSIHALGYVLNGGDVIFSRRTVNPYIGCDMPDTVCLIDNNAVFCSSKRGVFMLSSTVSENENNVLPISANVNGGTSGLITQIRLNSGKAASLDYDGKYHLFIGDKVYVWDYSEVPYLTNFGTVKAQRNLCWYILDGIRVNLPVEYCGQIFFFSDSGQINVYGIGTTDFDAPLSRTLTTAPSGLGIPRMEKRLDSITLSYRCKESVDISIYFYCDGRAGSDYSYAASLKHEDTTLGSFHQTTVPVSLPTAHSFNIKLEVTGGSFELDSIDYEYTV